MREYVRCRTVDSGEYMRVNLYPIHVPAGKRAAKCSPSSEIQQLSLIHIYIFVRSKR